MAELIAAACGGFVIGWACRWEALKRRIRKPPYSSAAIDWEEGHAQRGNGHGGPSTPKPEIKPQHWPRIVLNIAPLSAEDSRAIDAAVRAALAKQRGLRP